TINAFADKESESDTLVVWDANGGILSRTKWTIIDCPTDGKLEEYPLKLGFKVGNPNGGSMHNVDVCGTLFLSKRGISERPFLKMSDTSYHVISYTFSYKRQMIPEVSVP